MEEVWTSSAVTAVMDADQRRSRGPRQDVPRPPRKPLETSAELPRSRAPEAGVVGRAMEEAEDVTPDPTPTPEPEPEPTAEPPARLEAPRRPRPIPCLEDVDDDDELWEDGESNASSSRVAAPRSPAPPGRLPERRVVVIDEDADIATPTRPSGTLNGSIRPAGRESHPASRTSVPRWRTRTRP